MSSIELRHQAAVSPVAWQPRQGMDFTEWLHQGKRLGSIGRGVAWWIGDWVSYGNTKFGEKYSRAARITGYDVQSLMNMAYVASRFEFSRRRETLSWSHHAELAALDPREQDRWLVMADEKHLSVRGLRDELRAWRAKRGKASKSSALRGQQNQATAHTMPVPSTEGQVAQQDDDLVCPRCGYHIDAGSHHPEIPAPAPASGQLRAMSAARAAG